MTDTANLRRLASEATPGPWTLGRAQDTGPGAYDSGEYPIVWPPLGAPVVRFGPDHRPGIPERNRADAAYIAAANPQAITELLDERDEARDRYVHEAQQHIKTMEERDALLRLVDEVQTASMISGHREGDALRVTLDLPLDWADRARVLLAEREGVK